MNEYRKLVNLYHIQPTYNLHILLISDDTQMHTRAKDNRFTEIF